ncbi:MAG TPA: hypothetical protein PLD99_01965 [Parcubacteria group bacterium]|nr:hypothetical protein [Parcubacteria group bacterium]
MKKFLILIIIVGVAYGLYWYKTNNSEVKKVEIAPTVSKPDIANANFLFEGEEVKLRNGKSSTEIAPDSAVTIETALSGDIVYGDINNDSKSDAVSLATQTGGGSGLFVYLLAYVSGNVEYKSLDAVFLGDRISPESLKIDSNGNVLVSYLDRKASEPMSAEPTQLVKKTFKIVSGRLEER